MNKLKQQWLNLAERVDAMSLRERALIFLAAVLVLVTLINTLLIAPLLKRQGELSRQIVQMQTQTQALARGYALAVQRYENGVSSYLEVLDAQRSLFNAQLSLIAQERQYLTQTVRLYRALGGSWTVPR